LPGPAKNDALKALNDNPKSGLHGAEPMAFAWPVTPSAGNPPPATFHRTAPSSKALKPASYRLIFGCMPFSARIGKNSNPKAFPESRTAVEITG
jgi:hypothetical protein